MYRWSHPILTRRVQGSPCSRPRRLMMGVGNMCGKPVTRHCNAITSYILKGSDVGHEHHLLRRRLELISRQKNNPQYELSDSPELDIARPGHKWARCDHNLVNKWSQVYQGTVSRALEPGLLLFLLQNGFTLVTFWPQRAHKWAFNGHKWTNPGQRHERLRASFTNLVTRYCASSSVAGGSRLSFRADLRS